MDLTSLFRRGPYTAFPRRIKPTPHPELDTATWQVVSSPSGTPAVQLALTFGPSSFAIANPDMTLALLLDRSGSMTETYSSGHVYNLASALLGWANNAGTGYDLVFYNQSPSFAGHVDNDQQLRAALAAHPPGGGTMVADALEGTVKRYRKRRGIYMIVITDGEFSDKVAAQNLIMQTFLPQLTPQNPFAFRLHFVGAGGEVDKEFLEQLERTASSQGMAMVAGHHHAHISMAHTTIQAQLEQAFIGAGTHVEFKRADLPDPDSHHLARVGQQQLQNFHGGDDDRFDFLPRRSTWLIEVAPTTATQVVFDVSWQGNGPQRMSINAPFVSPVSRPAGWKLHWPWEPSGDAEQRKAAEEKARLAHEAELERQREDLKALGKGGIPITARKRLEELEADENAIFTCNLDPAEAALLRRVGYRPVATVSGSAMYHVGQAFASTMDCEVPVLSQAYDEATRLAVSRMEQELKILGAHGVLGVRFSMMRHEWGDKTVEVRVVGTAVEGPDARQNDEPFLCDLSGHEWWALRRAGYDPAELVWGHCSWFVFTDYYDEQMVRGYQNSEFTHWSKALHTARTRALASARQMASAEHATGLVGVRVERRLTEVRLTGPGEDPAYEREHHNLLVSIVGTAVRLRADAPRAIPRTATVLSLRDGRMTPVVLQETDATFE